MYIDSHAHFDLCLEKKNNTEESLIQGLQENNISKTIQISIDVNGLNWSYDFSKRYEGILFSAGIHPSSRAFNEDLVYISDFVDRIMNSEDKGLLFGIGEAGLDFYRMHQPREMQIQSFEHQLDLAKRWDLPIIVHSRDAMEETLSILKKKAPEVGLMHCFPGDKKIAKRVLDLGFYISYAGNLTYKKANTLHESALYIPEDRILLETDAPFLTPVPFRGKDNRPEYVIHTYKYLAELRKVSLSQLKDNIYDNFMSLLKKSYKHIENEKEHSNNK